MLLQPFSNMKLFYALLIVLGAAAIIVVILMPAKQRQGAYRRRPLMTPNEVEFYGRISRALVDLHVCPQVAMHALIEPTSMNSKTHLADFRRVSQKIVDYAIFDLQWALVAIIELDDRTHLASRDAIRDGFTGSAGICTLRYQSRVKPVEAQIAADIQAIRVAAVAGARVK